MNEMKKLLILIGIAVLFIVAIIVISFTGGNDSEEVYNKFDSAFNGTNNTLVYIGRPTCPYCNFLEPNLLDMKERYEFDYVYINTDEMNNTYMNKIMTQLNLTELGTPYLAIVSNGKVVATQDGYADYNITFEFLQKNKIISSEATLLLNYIGLEEYQELLKSKEEKIIVVGQSTCGYCTKAKITLNDIVEKNGTEINYFNLSYISQEEGAIFEASLDYFKNEQWGTPVTIIVKDGKIVDMLEQYVSESEYTEFFEENGVL